MNRRLSDRLTRVETQCGAAWMPWAEGPMDKWPDSALHGFLGSFLGIADAEAAALPDEALRNIAARRQGSHL
jgi:hypothetical protein